MRASSHRQITHAATMKGSTTKHTTCALITVKHTAKHSISLPRYALREPRGSSPAKNSIAHRSARMRQMSLGALSTEKNRSGTRLNSTTPSSTQRLRPRHATMSKAR